jgi:hypothetical protein
MAWSTKFLRRATAVKWAQRSAQTTSLSSTSALVGGPLRSRRLRWSSLAAWSKKLSAAALSGSIPLNRCAIICSSSRNLRVVRLNRPLRRTRVWSRGVYTCGPVPNQSPRAAEAVQICDQVRNASREPGSTLHKAARRSKNSLVAASAPFTEGGEFEIGFLFLESLRYSRHGWTSTLP